jgi:phosphotransacetylase
MRMTAPNADYIGPILLGMDKPIHILWVDAPVHRAVNLSALAVVHAQAAAPSGRTGNQTSTRSRR